MDEEYHDGLQIYAQGAWHEDARIVGTQEALTALRDAINAALEKGEETGALFFPSDGEGYEVKIKPVSSVDDLHRLPFWYVDEMANPALFQARLALQQRVFELEAALRKVKLHNKEQS